MSEFIGAVRQAEAVGPTVGMGIVSSARMFAAHLSPRGAKELRKVRSFVYSPTPSTMEAGAGRFRLMSSLLPTIPWLSSDLLGNSSDYERGDLKERLRFGWKPA